MVEMVEIVGNTFEIWPPTPNVEMVQMVEITSDLAPNPSGQHGGIGGNHLRIHPYLIGGNGGNHSDLAITPMVVKMVYITLEIWPPSLLGKLWKLLNFKFGPNLKGGIVGNGGNHFRFAPNPNGGNGGNHFWVGTLTTCWPPIPMLRHATVPLPTPKVRQLPPPHQKPSVQQLELSIFSKRPPLIFR